jgi:hypothetical protein
MNNTAKGFGPQIEQRLGIVLVGDRALARRVHGDAPTTAAHPIRLLPSAIVSLALIALAIHGPIAQFADYHHFADQRSWLGIPNALDVVSNLGFAAVGADGLYCLWSRRNDRAIRAGWPGFALFLVSLVLIAVGSAFYHLAPDDTRLIWDRLPIALACAGLLAGARAELRPNVNGAWLAGLLGLGAICSVLWWYLTGLNGPGDLRPYLLLQTAPLILIPLWQWIYDAPRADRIAFGIAVGLLVVARAAELLDHQLLALLHVVSGHTLKHLLATAAVAVITFRLARRS